MEINKNLPTNFKDLLIKIENIKILLIGIQYGLSKENPELASIIEGLNNLPPLKSIEDFYFSFLVEMSNKQIDVNISGDKYRLKVIAEILSK